MKIKKLAHCCLLIDIAETRILFDPGFYSLEEHDKISHVDIIFITHEHKDHFHIESVKALAKRSPNAKIIVNDAVGEILAKEGVEHHIMEEGDTLDVKDVHIQAFGRLHAIMHKSLPLVSNVGFMLSRIGSPEAKTFFYPGDALTVPTKEVFALALPVAGPWLKISEAIDYALELRPDVAFPVHDGVRIESQHLIPEKVLGANGIDFVKMEEGSHLEIQEI